MARGGSVSFEDRGFDRYLAAIGRFPILDRETELELARQYRAGVKEAGDRLVQANLRFVVKIANGYRGYGFRVADLVEEGNLGLLEAVRRFDPERKLRFMTYAAYWIRAYILAHVLKQWSIVGVGTGPLQSKLFFRLQTERASLAQKLGGDEGSIDATLAERFGTSVERIQAMSGRLAGRDSSLDAQVYDDSDVTMLDVLAADADDQEQRTADRQRDARVRAALRRVWHSLDERERLIVEERLLPGDEGATLAELGLRLGLSRERVRQLEERVKAKLRRVLEPLVSEAGLAA